MPLPTLNLSHPARFAFAIIAATIIAALIQMGSWRQESEHNLHKALLAARDDHDAAEAEHFLLPDDFVRGAQVFQRDREKYFARFEPILRAISTGGPAALQDEALRRRAARLSEPQRVALIWTFFLPRHERPGDIELNPADALPSARALLARPGNIAAFERIEKKPALLSRHPGDTPTSDMNFRNPKNREALYLALQALMLNGKETDLHKFVVDFVESPPVKPLSIQRQFVLTKEFEFLFLIGRGAKALEPARFFLDGNFIRNEILRDRLRTRIDVYTTKAAAASKAAKNNPPRPAAP